ncbi:MAG TPA: hypothetical protein VJ878_01790, partial [Candidatus Izemoplasmatales bacterium]|nr:hypothetical protein [Candidatus Izemoplasmatales bacterium]
ANDDYALYRIKHVDNFYVFDQYLSYRDFKNFERNANNIEAERLFMLSVLIDEERYDITDYDLKSLATNDLGMDILDDDVDASWEEQFAYSELRASFSNPNVQNEYYVYQDFGIEYNSGAVFINDIDGYIENYFGEIFYINDKGEEKACKFKASTSEIECGQFFSPIDRIYIEKTTALSAPTLEIRLERAIAGKSYLVYDISGIESGLNEQFIQLELDDYDIDKAYIVDGNKDEHYFTNGLLYSIDEFDKVYIYKNYDLYQEENLYGLKLNYEIYDSQTEDFNFDDDIVENKSLVLDHSVIDLSFDFISPSVGDHIVTIPVTYSNDWQFTSSQKYDKISVSGGFLGLVIPAGTNQVDVTLKFVPKNIRLGLMISLASTVMYAGVVVYPLIQRKMRRSDNDVESKTDRTSL